MNRPVIAFLIAVVLFAGVSYGQWGEISQVIVEPESPSASDLLTFHVSGVWGNSCVPQSMEIFVQGQGIYIDVIWDYPWDIYCMTVISGWKLSQDIDPLPAGEYTVYSRIRDVTEFAKSAVIFVRGEWGYWPPSEVVIVPENPAPADEITVVLEGEWLDTCVPTGVEARRDGLNIYLDVRLKYEPGTGCGDAITPWRQEVSLGKLDAASYTIYGRIAENMMVPATRYVKLKGLTVTAKRQERLYLFVPEKSFVTQTGGFAGIAARYGVDGMFALKINFEEGFAAFTDVDATLSAKGYLPTSSLGELFNMENLLSTSVTHDAIRFAGFTADDAEVVIEAELGDSDVHLVGRIRPECCDRFNYDLDGYAVLLKEPVCREIPEMDFTGDCRVDLADVAIFVQSWMECNLFPRSACR